MRCLKSLMLLGIFVLPICATSSTYRLDITPRTDNNIFEMELNTVVTFNAVGYEKKENVAIENKVQIDRVWWIFDNDILSKRNSQDDSITLKAARPGISELSAIGMLKNHSCKKTITILVTDTAMSSQK